MSSVIKIVEELQARGILFRLKDRKVKAFIPNGSPQNIVHAIHSLHAFRDEVRRYLERNRMAGCASPDCAGCYEVAPGVRIHPPKASQEWPEWLARWEPSEKKESQ